MSGLFVQKHAEAVRAQGVDVRVIHSEGWGDLWRQWKALRREGWMPDVVQLNVIQKQGLLALWLKRHFHIPYIIVEHWSGYLPQNGQYMHMSWIKRRWYRSIAWGASVVLSVSQRHQQAMQECGIRAKKWGVVHNVVDDFFYEDAGSRDREVARSRGHEGTVFLHVSCFDERAKNVKGLLRAAKKLSEKRQDWRLVLVGTGVDYQEVRDYADRLSLPERLLEWTGELSPQQVAERFEQADVFVLPSNYENAPVVLSEALATGTPVIATRVGGIPEMVDESCGLLVNPGDDDALTEAMETMSDQCHTYKNQPIREAGLQYSFARVGAQLKAVYDSVIERS